MSKRLLAAGYFGCGNLGDDALLLAFRDTFDSLGYDLSALSGAPEETQRNFGIPSTPRKEMGRVKQAIEECDALVFPGGSIFQDVTSAKSVLYYAGLVKIAKKSGKKVIMLGQGVGPLTSFFGKQAARSAFQAADAIAVRDAESGRMLQALGISKPAKLTADLAFLLPPPPSGSDDSAFQVGSMRTVGLAPRPHGKGKETAELFGELARQMFQNNIMPVLIEMDRVNDKALLDAIEKSQGGKVPGVRKLQHPTDLQRRLARMEAVVAMRLHAGILATTVNVPSVMLSYDPKVSAFASEAGLPNLPANNLTVPRVLEALTALLKDRPKAVEKLQSRHDHFRKAAEGNIELLRSTCA